MISETGELPFASVSLYRVKDSSLVNGVIADDNGKFEFNEIKYGRYYLSITFVGFEPLTVKDIQINSSHHIVKLQNLNLTQDIKALNEVEVTSSAPALDYQIDKKVVNVDKQITATSGSAVDVLANVPSVQVDVTGEVTLRGSSGFMVFIDGKPSVLSGSEALNQIPASTIDKIELITNPSAKYDPDGTSGIINIVTKKNMLEGFSGVVNGNIGIDDKYGGDFLFYYRKKKFNYFVGADYNHRYFPGIESSKRLTTANDTVYAVVADGDNQRTSTRYSFKGGIESQFTVRDYISFNASIGKRAYDWSSELDYRETTTPFTSVNQYTSVNTHVRGGPFYSLNSDYEHKFRKENHKLSAQIVYNYRLNNETNDNELILPGGEVQSGQKSTENGPSNEFRVRLDYELPLADKMKMEAGSQYRKEISNDTNKVYNLNDVSNEYEFQPLYSNSVRYDRDIYALYGIYRNEKHKLGYQVGVRTEYTGRFIEKLDGDSSVSLYRWDFFPSIHISYKLPKDHQIMLNYSRRINRPRGWYFEPFITWVDAFNVRQGNPELLPEYVDSYELGYSKRIKKSMFSIESYYRQVHNKIERIRSVYEENIIMTTFDNVGTDHSLGVEGLISTDIFKWWNIDLMGNLYYFRGDYNIPTLNNESTNWNTRFNNTFYISKTLQFQVNSMYASAMISAQGRIEDNYMVNAAIKKTFYNRKLSATLQGSDIFQTSRRQYTSAGPDFVTENFRRRLSPIVMLNVSYRINNYKMTERGRSGEFNGGDDF